MTRQQVEFNLDSARLRLMEARIAQRDAAGHLDWLAAAYCIMIATHDIANQVHRLAMIDDQPELTDINPTHGFVMPA